MIKIPDLMRMKIQLRGGFTTDPKYLLFFITELESMIFIQFSRSISYPGGRLRPGRWELTMQNQADTSCKAFTQAVLIQNYFLIMRMLRYSRHLREMP